MVLQQAKVYKLDLDTRQKKATIYGRYIHCTNIPSAYVVSLYVCLGLCVYELRIYNKILTFIRTDR